MSQSLAKQLAMLERTPMAQLREQYQELFFETTNTKNKTWLLRRLAWRIQALAEGGLSERAQQRAAELANDADLRVGPPRPTRGHAVAAPVATSATPTGTLPSSDDRLPLPGTILTRLYKGVTVQVKVLEHGLEYEGEIYKSLSAVAKAITGSHCNGFLFFRLQAQGGQV